MATPVLLPYQFSYNGLLMGPGTSFGVVSIEGLDLPDVRMSDIPRPRDHGEYQGLDLMKGRDVTLDLFVTAAGSGYSSLQAALQDLATATAPQTPMSPGMNAEVPLYFQLPNMNLMEVMCRPRKRALKIDPNYAAAQYATPTVQFHATDPRVYDGALQNVNVALPTPPGGLNFQTNLVGADDSDFENSIGTWGSPFNCTLAQTVAQAHTGTHSMSLTATATAASMNATTGQYAIWPNQQYLLIAWVRAATTARNCQVFLTQYDAAGVAVVTTPGVQTADSNSAWTQVTFSGTTNQNAVTAQVGLQVLNQVSTEVHYIDTVSLYGGLAFAFPETNLLSADDSDFETSVGDWANTVNCSIATTAAQSHTRIQSLAITCNGGASPSTETARGLSAVPVLPYMEYSISAWVRAASTTRSVSVIVEWFNAAGTSLGTAPPFGDTDSSSTWLQTGAAYLAPSTAAFAAAKYTIAGTPANGEVHYLDTVTFQPTGLSFGAVGGGGIIQAANNGNFETRPVATITGPCVNPRISNDTTGQQLYFNLTLAATDVLVVYFDSHAVLLNPSNTSLGANRRAALGALSSWWTFPANTTTQVSFHSIDNVPTGATLSFSWRQAWMI